jgi:hypothetical protein
VFLPKASSQVMPSKNGGGGIQSGSNHNNIHLVILKSFVQALLNAIIPNNSLPSFNHKIMFLYVKMLTTAMKLQMQKNCCVIFTS